MKDWTTRLVVMGLLALVLGVPFALRPSDAARPRSSDADSPNRLVILTPHNEQIRFEFGRAFNAWRIESGRPALEFDWRSSGGTSDLRKQVEAQFLKAAESGMEERGVGVDLFFGGGDFDHNLLAKGVVFQRDGKEMKLPLTVPINVPDSVMKEVYPEPTVGGVPLYHPEKRWVGVVLSSFGIIHNNDVHQMLRLPTPQTWADLEDGRYRGWIALADPEHSSSIAVTYATILKRRGWTEGWASLRRVFANARYFTSSSTKVPVDVSSGESAAGMCIDFYGRFQAGAIGGERVAYVDPPFMTAVTPDPVSLMRGAPHAELAREFVLWLLSTDSQGIWQRRKGEPGGPVKFELRRMPVRRDMFNDGEMARWVDHNKPFEIAKPFPKAMPDFFSAVRPIVHAIAIDVHDDLIRAWETILATSPDDPRRAEMLSKFDAMPEELTLRWPDAELEKQWRDAIEDPKHPRHADAAATLKKFVDDLGARSKGWKDRDKVLEDRMKWTLFFRDNYRAIAAMRAR